MKILLIYEHIQYLPVFSTIEVHTRTPRPFVLTFLFDPEEHMLIKL